MYTVARRQNFLCYKSFICSINYKNIATSSHINYDLATNLLYRYNISGQESILYQFLNNNPEKLTLAHYITILKTCKQLSVSNLDLLASPSQAINQLLLDGSYETLVSSDNTSKFANELKDNILALCEAYNSLGVLYDPLFLTISNILSQYKETFGPEEIEVLLRTYSLQRYNDVELVRKLIDFLVETECRHLTPSTAASIYLSLAHLDYLSSDIKSALEGHFMSSEGKFIEFSGLNASQLLDVAYSNLLTRNEDSLALRIITSALITSIRLVEDSPPEYTSRRICMIVSYLKCKFPDIYSEIDDDVRRRLELISNNSCYKSTNTTKFISKLSQHLVKMRINHDCNVYRNGILLDILERDRNLVWLCNSYHRFYATTFNKTANSRLMEYLLRLYGYRLCQINYYQWGRMKCKRTRYSFIRMSRYYALNDKREQDPEYCGWSLPYIWWNVGKKSQTSTFVHY